MSIYTLRISLCLLAALAPSLVAAKKCEEQSVSAVCECGHYSYKNGYQCNKCKDKFKWGYGCDLECSKEKCPFGCDFAGNCQVPAECKRNGRVDNPTDIVTNDRGECQACDSGFYGLYCSKRCPANCGDSAEGKCTRGGLCYKCKKGFYGRLCDQPCPSTCPECVFEENLVQAPDGASFLPAGSCPKQCTVDKWGGSCDQPCPANCKKTQGSGKPRIPSCRKENGNCMKCEGHLWWGQKCENKCSSGCEGGKCNMADGLCEAGCKNGWWGPKCDKQCAEGCMDGACSKTDGMCENGCKAGWYGGLCNLACPAHTGPGGCDQQTSQPSTCESGYYPEQSAKDHAWSCHSCPDNCLNHQCDQDGSCTEGCEPSFYGNRCHLNCPTHCDGPCDTTATGLTDGWCPACEEGWTGKKCTKKCHPTCRTCDQRGNGVGPEDCTACNLNEPVELVKGHCQCIEGATRNEDDQKCYCNEPDGDSMKQARFELLPAKLCRFICQDGYKEVHGNKESICITNDVYKAVVRAEAIGFDQGDCQEGDWQVQVGKETTKCIRKDFADYIISE